MKRTRSPSFSLEGDNTSLELYTILTFVARSLLEPSFTSDQLKEPKVLARKLLLYPDPTKIGDAPGVECVKEGILFISPLQYNLLGCTSDFVLEHRLASYVPFQCNFLQGVLRVYFKHTRLRVKDDHLEWQLELDKYEFTDECYFGRFFCLDIPKEGKDRKYGICKGVQCKQCRHVIYCDVHSKGKDENDTIRLCKRNHDKDFLM